MLWPQALPGKNAVTQTGLWHVCPAHVYEARVSAMGQVQVVVNFENCIKCETCWRTSDIVDWGRDGAQRFVYAVHSPVTSKLLADMDRAGTAPPAQPYPAADDGTAGPLDATLAKLERSCATWSVPWARSRARSTAIERHTWKCWRATHTNSRCSTTWVQ